MRLSLAGRAAGVLALLPLDAIAHLRPRGCDGHELLIPRQTDSLDPTAQCQYYNYQPVQDIKAKYPTIWTTATIQGSDTEAQSLFSQINATIQQKAGSVVIKPASTAGYSYDRSDPDCWWTWQGCTKPADSIGVAADLIDVPEPHTLGLTIDDGPNCSQNALYEYLREQKQRATMFFIGSNIFGWPVQAIQAHKDGHEICVHTWSHQPMTTLTNEQAFAELYYTRKAIKDIIGVTPKCWRPPQGDVDNRIRLIAAGLNLTTIIWNLETDDWRAQAVNSTVSEADVDKNYQKIVDQGKNNFTNHGGVVLTHQSTNYTMSTLLKWLPQLTSAWTHVVPLASAYNWTRPYVETDVTYPDFNAYISGSTSSSSSSSSSPSSPPSSTTGSGSGANAVSASAPASATGTVSAAASTTSRSAALRTSDIDLRHIVPASILLGIAYALL
ncbi:Chitin deacetylase [Saitozyma sp. JCM 24511]|nr:Chitin deacetylase [Saitozyma sp. JCM 24511]